MTASALRKAVDSVLSDGMGLPAAAEEAQAPGMRRDDGTAPRW
jgi:hypothetical protein